MDDFLFFAELHHYLDLSMFYSGGEMFESHSDECRTLKGEDFALQYFSRSPKLNSKLFFFFIFLFNRIKGLKINMMRGQVVASGCSEFCNRGPWYNSC